MKTLSDEIRTAIDRGLTAWDLCACWSWTEHYRARRPGGRVLWWEAQTSETGQTVRLARLVTVPALRQINRYVAPDTRMELVPQSEEKSR